MLAEVLAGLRPRVGGRYADGTVGGGGHAAALLELSAPDGWLYGSDRDAAAVEAAKRRLAEFSGRFEIRLGNVSELAAWIASDSCDGVLLDLGLSSPQLDWPERGFSFQHEGPLDMRMDQRQHLTAAHLINESSAESLARIFWEYGGERESRRLARAIEGERKLRSFETTRQLALLIEKVIPRGRHKTHPATKVFQALRIAVNDELAMLRPGLNAAWKILRPGGRLAVITFHSLEDRIVKEFGRELEREYRTDGQPDIPEMRIPKSRELRWVSRKAIQPTTSEVRDNPRARSAQLRVMEKI
jgi:16S rRNA (cytosine1402-N4)-methyltransferase